MFTNADHPASCTDLARRVRPSPFTARFSTYRVWSLVHLPFVVASQGPQSPAFGPPRPTALEPVGPIAGFGEVSVETVADTSPVPGSGVTYGVSSAGSEFQIGRASCREMLAMLV